ncbi:MAG: type IV pilus secretin PilQ [Myxococcota bacterium]
MFTGPLRVGIVALVMVAAALPEARAQDAVPQVAGAYVAAQDDVTVVSIPLSAEGGKPVVSPFRLTSPERVVIDISGAKLAEGAKAEAGGIVQRAEFTPVPDDPTLVRLTLWLAGPANWSVSQDGGSLSITLTPGQVADPLAEALGAEQQKPGEVRLSGPLAAQAGAALTSLDFQQRDRTSRVLIGVQDAEPAVSQPERDLIAVDIPGAKVPESLQRPLDTRFFYSAVDSVRATGTRAGARITIRMREGAEYQVLREGGLTVLEIQIPEDILAAREAAVQKASAVAPSTPETNGGAGIQGVGGDERLITGSGKTVDAQSVFGEGKGSQQAGSFGFAQSMTTASSGRSSARRMSIDLQDADISTVFRFVADFADINIIASDDVQGKVTVRLKDVPWDEALAAVLQAKGLGAQQLGGNIVRVAPIETIKAEQQAALEAKRATLDLEELSVYVAPLNYATANEVTDQVTSVLSDRGSVQVDERGNQLIIRDAESNIAQARELLKAMDKPNRQVTIEARFVEAATSASSALGIQWGGEVDASGNTGYPTGWFFPSTIGVGGGIANSVTRGESFYTAGTESLLVDLGTSESSGAISFALGSIPGLVDIDVRLSAAERDGWGKVISSPRVTTLDNEEANVVQGARVPFTSVSNGGTQVQFIDANLELTVTPHITAEGTIFMDIDISNDRPDFSTTVNGNPAIQTKSLTTRVLVPDGDTAVLGGVYATTETWSQERIPLLGKIPIIGYLFKNSFKTHEQNEMLVFITPHIVPLETRASAETGSGT